MGPLHTLGSLQSKVFPLQKSLAFKAKNGDMLNAEAAAPGKTVELLPCQQCRALRNAASILEFTVPLPAIGRHCAAVYPACSNDGVFLVQERLAFKAKKEDMLRNSFRAEGAESVGQVSQVRAALFGLT